MQGLARNVFLGDLTLEFDAVGAVLGHGFHPWKPGKFRSIPNLQSVHRLGCTPLKVSLAARQCQRLRSTKVSIRSRSSACSRLVSTERPHRNLTVPRIEV